MLSYITFVAFFVLILFNESTTSFMLVSCKCQALTILFFSLFFPFVLKLFRTITIIF